MRQSFSPAFSTICFLYTPNIISWISGMPKRKSNSLNAGDSNIVPSAGTLSVSQSNEEVTGIWIKCVFDQAAVKFECIWPHDDLFIWSTYDRWDLRQSCCKSSTGLPLRDRRTFKWNFDEISAFLCKSRLFSMFTTQEEWAPLVHWYGRAGLKAWMDTTIASVRVTIRNDILLFQASDVQIFRLFYFRIDAKNDQDRIKYRSSRGKVAFVILASTVRRISQRYWSHIAVTERIREIAALDFFVSRKNREKKFERSFINIDFPLFFPRIYGNFIHWSTYYARSSVFCVFIAIPWLWHV